MNESAGAGPGVGSSQVVDFRRPAPLLVEQGKVIRALHDDLAERLSPLLSSRLRTPCRLIVDDQEMVSGDELAVTGDDVPVTAVIDSPLGAQMVWRVPARLASIIADLLLGGTGRGDEAAPKLTDIEIQIVGKLIQQCLGPLAVVWEHLLHLRPRLATVHADREATLPIAPGEPALCVRFRVVLGVHDLESTLWIPNGLLTLALRGLEPTNGAGGHTAAEAGAALPVEVLRTVPVDVAVAFPPVGMTPAAILALQVGDVIPLHPVEEPLELTAGDVRIGWVRPAQHAGRTACQVTRLDQRPRAVRA